MRDEAILNAFPVCRSRIRFLRIDVVHLFNKLIQTAHIFMLANSHSKSAAQEVEIDWP